MVIVARNQTKGEAARQEIQVTSGNTAVDLLLADLSSQASVHQLAATFLERYEHLHVLINNAGVFLTKRTLTVDHLEMTFAVNHLAPFLLTQLLLERLKASASARIVNVCSGAHYTAHLQMQDLQLQQGYNVWRAYAQSKLAMLLCSYKLARQLEGSGVTLNCLNPGFVFTNMGMSNVGPRAQSVAKAILSCLGSSPEKGALTSLYLAMSPEVEQVTGKYFDKLVPKRTSKESYDQALQEQVWAASMQLVKLPMEA
ncbi:short-chain dehydrogenase [Dictyobacter aurantiacus]|uniref:Short-chain dehydrogenase n=1 Tax=Dictyobacter aurantiacus TaxID=1936993 RepID=A0A401ZM47_9CHLR|nr:short-chain dehydrogenase [Dictyobacter aurantiacus]